MVKWFIALLLLLLPPPIAVAHAQNLTGKAFLICENGPTDRFAVTIDYDTKTVEGALKMLGFSDRGIMWENGDLVFDLDRLTGVLKRVYLPENSGVSYLCHREENTGPKF